MSVWYALVHPVV